MLDYLQALGLFSVAEHSYLRLEAMDLFERCLTEGSPDYLTAFIDQQITQEPPRIGLLQQIAEDLHQRLLALREYHFDVRERVLNTLRADFKIELNVITPPHALDEYHLLTSDRVLHFAYTQNPKLTAHDQFIMRKVVDSSLNMASQLHSDISMTQELFDYILDWTDALRVAATCQYRLHTWDDTPHRILH